MEIEQILEITFDSEEIILAATISKPTEVVILMNSGSVIRYSLDEQKGKQLFTIKNDLKYSDGGFDLAKKSSIYTLDEIVVVVNDYKRHVYDHYPTKYNSFHLEREEHHENISSYPIALYKNENGIPHLIYAVAWNHIQIMNLDTKEILTASKSLFEEHAKEKYMDLHKKIYGNIDKFDTQWEPSPYDYFFGKLKISPDSKYFLSKGWAWGSSDSYNVYEINHFIKSNEISQIKLGDWEHLNRAACWVDEKTVAFGYNAFAEDDNNVDYRIGAEIHFSKITREEFDNKIIKVEGINTISAEMEFSKKINSIVLFSRENGVAIISLDGKILLQNSACKVDDYFADMNLFLTVNAKTILINKLTD